MAKAKLAKIPDWLVGLALTAAIVALFFLRLDFLTILDAKLFDLRMKLLGARPADDRIAIVAIDDESIAKLGRWPWPRSRIAAVVDQLARKGTGVIGFTVLFSEAEESGGLQAVQALEQAFLALNLGPVGAPFLEKVRQVNLPPELYATVGKALRKAVDQRFQTGAELAATLRACVARAPVPAG